MWVPQEFKSAYFMGVLAPLPQELIREVAAADGREFRREGLQRFLDRHGTGATVMGAAEAIAQREAARRLREVAHEEATRAEHDAHSFDDLTDEEIHNLHDEL